MLVSAQEALGLRDYIMQLNSIGGGSTAVAVEGKRDTAALRKVGYTGKILEFHRFGGMGNFVDHAAKYDTVVVLFDRDRKGRHMTYKVAKLLQRRTNVDLSLRRKLWEVTGGRIMYIEQLICYDVPALVLRDYTRL